MNIFPMLKYYVRTHRTMIRWLQLQKLWLTRKYGDKQTVHKDLVHEYGTHSTRTRWLQLQTLWLTKNYGDKQRVYPDLVYEYSCKDVDLGAKDNYKTIYMLIEYTEKLSEVVKIVIMIQN